MDTGMHWSCWMEVSTEVNVNMAGVTLFVVVTISHLDSKNLQNITFA